MVGEARDAFDDVIDVGEIALMLAVIEQFQRRAFGDRPGKLDGRHVGPPHGPYTVKKRRPVLGMPNRWL
jgi:hypothetical protein